MRKCFSLICVSVLLATGMSYAQSSAITKVHKTAATSGRQMYGSYCASCHGLDGRGHGPVSSELKMTPTDLTLLRRNNQGKFPDARLVAVLQYGANVPSHGTAEMPVWGPMLGRMNKANPQIRQLRISNLIQYLKTLQAK